MHLPCGTVQYRHSLQYSGYIPAAGYSRFSLLYTSSGFFEIWENHPIFSLWSTKEFEEVLHFMPGYKSVKYECRPGGGSQV